MRLQNERILVALQLLIEPPFHAPKGHSEAKIAEAEIAVANGVTCITHLFNAMQAVSIYIYIFMRYFLSTWTCENKWSSTLSCHQ